MAAEGLRVLALCAKRVPAGRREIALKDIDTAFSLLGLVGRIDPPREAAIAAVQKRRTAGIRVKMIVEAGKAIVKKITAGGRRNKKLSQGSFRTTVAQPSEKGTNPGLERKEGRA